MHRANQAELGYEDTKKHKTDRSDFKNSPQRTQRTQRKTEKIKKHPITFASVPLCDLRDLCGASKPINDGWQSLLVKANGNNIAMNNDVFIGSSSYAS